MTLAAYLAERGFDAGAIGALAAAATLHVVAQRLRQHVKAYVDDAPVKQVWPEYNRWVGFFEARALVYHGVCTILSSAFLITFLVAFAALCVCRWLFLPPRKLGKRFVCGAITIDGLE